MDDLWGFQQPKPQYLKFRVPSYKKQNVYRDKTKYAIITFMGSKLTRPQARAAIPLQLRETATMPIESGPGYLYITRENTY